MYYLILECENARLNDCLGLKKGIIFSFLVLLNRVRVQELLRYTSIQNSREHLPPGLGVRLRDLYFKSRRVEEALVLKS